jgi:Pyruvate/2-oxoacid:ferredoxin oxidoreductase delta subunit
MKDKNRNTELCEIFSDCLYFKIVCGAGNEDPGEVNRLSTVYTLAGALGIDVSANVDIVRAAGKGIDRAFTLASTLGIVLEIRPFITVSVGIAGDPHVRKARIIEEKCSACGLCLHHCDQQAIDSDPPVHVLTMRCIGCGQCSDICPEGAVEYFTRKVDFQDILPHCLSAGAENIELHAIIANDDLVMQDFKIITEVLPDQYISLCLDRSQLSNDHLIRRIEQALAIAGDRLIIQADGAPMSGGKDDYNTTLQSVAIADIVQKSGLPVKILLSGGTNSKTGELAGLCGLRVHGVSVGTNARNLVRSEVNSPDFDHNPKIVAAAVEKAKWLVEANMKHLRRGEC